MKKSIKKTCNGNNIYCYEFNSIHEFYKFITEKETNPKFGGKEYSKSTKRQSWYGTKTFDECIDLLNNGWEEGSKELTARLKDISKIDCMETVINRQVFDVVGFQASVPRYLQGIPTSMVNQKRIVQKQKVVTVSKSIAFTSNFSFDEIINESVKCLRVIKKIEAQGVRCNLNILNVNKCGNEYLMVKVRVKNSSERLSVSKLAFLMAHPSVKRRLIFRFVEVFDETSRNWSRDYGCSIMRKSELEEFAEKGEIILPSIVDIDVEDEKQVDKLIAVV